MMGEHGEHIYFMGAILTDQMALHPLQTRVHTRGLLAALHAAAEVGPPPQVNHAPLL